MKRILYSIMLLTVTGNAIARQTQPTQKAIRVKPLPEGYIYSGAHTYREPRSQRIMVNQTERKDNPTMEKFDTLFNTVMETFSRSGELLLEEESKRAENISNALAQLNKKLTTQMSKEENLFLTELTQYIAHIPGHIRDALSVQETSLVEAHNVMLSRIERMERGIHEFMNAQEEVSRAASRTIQSQTSSLKK
jgi:hypothetical protein